MRSPRDRSRRSTDGSRRIKRKRKRLCQRKAKGWRSCGRRSKRKRKSKPAGIRSLRAVVQVWDSMGKIQAWRNNPEYKELRKVGEKYAKFRAYTIEGLPQ